MKQRGQVKACRLCLAEEKLCHSHIIPDVLYKPCYDNKHRIIVVEDVDKGRVTRHQQTAREYLLCQRCESHINVYEKYARRFFFDPLPPLLPGSGAVRIHQAIDYRLMKLFFLSILWRASVSKLPEFLNVNLGPHEELIREKILNNDPGRDSEYGTWITILNLRGKQLKDFSCEVTYSRFKEQRCYRFVLCGFWICMLVSKTPAPESIRVRLLSPNHVLKTVDSEIGDVAFLREVLNRAGETTRNVDLPS